RTPSAPAQMISGRSAQEEKRRTRDKRRLAGLWDRPDATDPTIARSIPLESRVRSLCCRDLDDEAAIPGNPASADRDRISFREECVSLRRRPADAVRAPCRNTATSP